MWKALAVVGGGDPVWGSGGGESPRWLITRVLQPGEQLLWVGQPDPKVVFSKADALLVPFTLLWAGFTVFWEVGVAGSGGPLFALVYGAVFMAVGAYITVGRFLYKRYDRRRTVYGVTDRRVLVLRNQGRQLLSESSQSAPQLTEWSRDRRHGSVAWGAAAPIRRGLGGGGFPPQMITRLQSAGWPMAGQMGGVALWDVPDFDRRLQALRQAQGHR